MRLLYAGHADACLSSVAGEPGPERRGDPLLVGGQPVPLHGLSKHREGRAIRCAQAARRSGRDVASADGSARALKPASILHGTGVSVLHGTGVTRYGAGVSAKALTPADTRTPVDREKRDGKYRRQ